MTTSFSEADKEEIFSHHHDNGPFSALAVVTACLNYLDRLNRTRLNPLAAASARTAALHDAVRLEGKLFRYIQDETPISYVDADFKEQTEAYILLRSLFIKAVSFTFTRHRMTFLLDLLQLYTEDPCSILPTRDIERAMWEHTLLYDYLLLDMGQKNTEDIGREAVSNGYHECDYTLEIEEVWKQPMKAIPRQQLRYVIQCLPYSRAARAAAVYLQDHADTLAFNQWVVDAGAIEQLMKAEPVVTPADIAAIRQAYVMP